MSHLGPRMKLINDPVALLMITIHSDARNVKSKTMLVPDEWMTVLFPSSTFYKLLSVCPQSAFVSLPPPWLVIFSARLCVVSLITNNQHAVLWWWWSLHYSTFGWIFFRNKWLIAFLSSLVITVNSKYFPQQFNHAIPFHFCSQFFIQ